MVLAWSHPFSAILAGASQSGKSFFVRSFIKHIKCMIDVPIEEVIWCFSEKQAIHRDMECPVPVRFHEGLPDMESFPQGSGPRLIIIDDMMREAGDEVVDLFTKTSHHRNISVIFITQNLFHQGKGRRDVSLNAHYVVVFKNPRDRAQISAFARQVCPDNQRFILHAYQQATDEPHGYLLFDFKQDTPDMLRFRTKVLPTDGSHPVVFTPTLKRGNKRV
jgi:hypothetical protein